MVTKYHFYRQNVCAWPQNKASSFVLNALGFYACLTSNFLLLITDLCSLHLLAYTKDSLILCLFSYEMNFFRTAWQTILVKPHSCPLCQFIRFSLAKSRNFYKMEHWKLVNLKNDIFWIQLFSIQKHFFLFVWLAWMELNLYDYCDFQPKIRCA